MCTSVICCAIRGELSSQHVTFLEEGLVDRNTFTDCYRCFTMNKVIFIIAHVNTYIKHIRTRFSHMLKTVTFSCLG